MRYKNCPKCKGFGIIRPHLGSILICPFCEGEGVIRTDVQCLAEESFICPFRYEVYCQASRSINCRYSAEVTIK